MATPLVAVDRQALPPYLHIEQWQVFAAPPSEGVYLCWQNGRLSLMMMGEKGQVTVDFTAGRAKYRRLQGGGELLLKAVAHKQQPMVWDATGGLGRDAFVLASAGLEVVVFERHPAVAALLADGLWRAKADEDIAEIVARITLHQVDAAKEMAALAARAQRPDVVYLDPMYPERQKSAAVKKEMAYFHHLLGEAVDDEVLLMAALQVAKKRVVVKRPRLGALLAGQKPHYQYTGKSTRFDVYQPCSGSLAS